MGFLVLPVEAGGVGWCRNKTGKFLVLCYLPRSIGATQKPAFLSDFNTLPSDFFTSASRGGMAVCVCVEIVQTPKYSG